jgi:hypothetical protein
MKKIRSPTTDFSTPVSAQLDRLEGIPGILARAEAYALLARQLESSLPPAMQTHVRFSSIDKQTLRFLAASSAWATKLRFLSSDLVALANRLGFQAVTALAVRVSQRTL